MLSSESKTIREDFAPQRKDSTSKQQELVLSTPAPQLAPSLPYHIHWAQQACSLPTLVPVCESVKSRGALLTAFSRDGLLLAVAVNQSDPKSKGKRLQLRSLSSLKASLLKQNRNQNSTLSTIPKFLQEEETAELSERAADLQDYEEESDDDKQFQNNSSTFCSQGPNSFFSRADQGQLEFASMFDTVHAKDDTDAKDDLSMELNSIQKNLLAAWGIGISKNVQEKDMLLNYTVGCITHLFNILQFSKSSLLNHDAFLNQSEKYNLWMHCILKHFQQCLTVLYWDVRDRQTVGHLVKLTSQTVKLMLIQLQDQLFSEYLLGCFCLLKMVAHSLNGKFTPCYEIMSASSDVNTAIELDSLIVPIFQVLDGSSAQKFRSLNSLLKIPPQAVKLNEKPENRLMILWRLLYKQVLWYRTQLNRKISKDGKPLTEMKIAHEESIVAQLLGHIQAVLQSSGETLEQTQKLNSVIDAEHSQYELWMIREVHPEAAVAVIRSMARFMAAYFTNQLLYILPPHKVDILPPLHINQDRFPRVVSLQHSVVASAVRYQKLSSVWTAEYALDLLFVGGLIPEAVWLAHKLGDWKMSVSIGVAYNLYCQSGGDFLRSEKTELHLPLNLTPTQIFQEKLQSFLGQPVSFETSNEGSTKYKQFTVPDGLYLPAPPLYCPQPASFSEKDYNDSPLKIERDYRQKVSGVLQRIMLLFRAARCSCPVAQWYIVQLKWARKVMQKIRMKGTLPSLSSFPKTLLHYSKFSTIFFRSASSGDHCFDDISCKTIDYPFIECKLRHSPQLMRDCKKAEYDASIVEHCLNAVEWACRMLPFARFMNVEELVQDIILSLVGELPPIRKVAEILVKAFPNSEDVRVPLRDKYHALQQRLRHCIVRAAAAPLLDAWVVVALAVLCVFPSLLCPFPDAPLLPGTSLSRSTLSDCGNPQVYSDAEAADTLSEALLTEETRNQAPSPQRETRPHTEEQTGSKKTAYKIKYLNWKAKHKEQSKVLPNQHTLPVVGAWEFERDDDEYVKFLDLFLSYMLERDFNCSDPGIPFLTSFSELLREHELHSLLFDVHTTLKRRQGRTNSQNVFRAGCCYAVTLASCDSKPASLCNEKKKYLENQISVSVLQPADSLLCDSVNGVKKYMGKKGLFGLNHLSVYRAQDNKQEITITPITQTLSDHACSSLQTSVTCKYTYKAIHVNDVIPREELCVELKNKFSSIARLLEWMIRWSDRRLLYDTNKIESFQESRPMMHVKTSAAAILTSLWLLGRPYSDESQARITSFKSPDYQYLMNSASLPETRSKIQKESSMDTGCSPSTETPHALQDVNAYDEVSENVLGISTKTKHSEKNEMNESYSVTHSTEEGVIGFDEEEVGAFLKEEIDATSENEGVESPWEEPMMEKLEEKKAKQNGVTYNGPVCSKKQEVQDGEQISEPLNVSEAVRKMLQDEMFKLVQLQQVNFLNLMQMVGSSFASLPNMQHLLQQSQAIQLGGSQASHTVRGSGADTSLPVQSADISPETQLPTKENAGKSNKKSSSPSQERSILNDQSSKESIHVDIQKTHKLIPVAKTLNYENGFPLLKLESDHLKPLNLYPLKVSQAFIGSLPQPRVVWDPSSSLQNPPLSCMLGDKTISMTHLNLNRYDPEMIRQVYEEKKRWAEAESKSPPKLLNLDQYEGEQNFAPLQHLPTNVSAEKPRSAQHASFYGTYQHSAGIPLLHLQLDPAPRFPPIIRPPVPASLIPVRPITEETNCRDTLQHTRIPILHTNLPPKNKFQPPKLIPIQNLIAFEQSRQCTSAPHEFSGQDHSGQIELLKANTEPFDARHTWNNTKRQQKRRAEKQIKEKEDKKKTSVTFRPDDSIIGTDDIEKVFETEIQRTMIMCFPILDTVGEAVTTSAGLHCMASTRKKPAETQDASTNTDPEHLASRVPQMLPPDMYLNFRFHTEVGERLLPSSGSDTAPDLIGHTYINVIDIEDNDLLKDLPTIAECTEEMVTTQQENFEVPSSAKLHHMAASVTNAIPPNKFQRKDDHQNDLFPVQERDIKSLAGRHNLTWNLLHEDVRIIHSTGLSPKIISKEHFCKKLQEMDIQLQALQNIADNMEKDFSNTKLIVKTIEDLGMAASPNLGADSLFSEGVGVIDEAHYVSSVDFEDLMDEEEEGSRPEHSVTSYTALQAHSLSPANSSAKLLGRIKSSSGYEHLYTHPPPDSLVVDAANKHEWQGYQGPSPKNWEAKRLDLFRRKVYSTGSLQLRISNHQAIQFGLSAKEIKLSQKKKDEKDKSRPGSRSLSASQAERSRTAAKPDFGKARSHSTPPQGLAQSGASDYQTLSTRNLRRPTPSAAAIQREETGLDYESERDSISPWSVPDDIQRLLHDDYDSLLEVSVPHEEDCSPLSVNDSVSESTGSILSKLDWNAVEVMVANVEEK
ncbi:Putative protein C5orf42 [Chelonia mydas]|uniref:Ciliogenesis and planar polarity effector 1 n=1 Tax=Chelonia mydas TaxID=8469 RepID=M7B450_CHEMY|nr:Putative protein C5orf42 [Chelonia mydas]